MEGTYEDTKSRELCGPGMSGKSKVNVGLTQGSALSPLLFIAVVKLISRKICVKDILRKLLYSDVQQTWTGSMFGEDGGNVGGTQEERAVNTPGWEEA